MKENQPFMWISTILIQMGKLGAYKLGWRGRVRMKVVMLAESDQGSIWCSNMQQLLDDMDAEYGAT
jgi:hypothetical protein